MYCVCVRCLGCRAIARVVAGYVAALVAVVVAGVTVVWRCGRRGRCARIYGDGNMARNKRNTRKTNKAVRKSIAKTQIRRSATRGIRSNISAPTINIERATIQSAVTPARSKITSRIQPVATVISTPLPARRSETRVLRRRCKDRPNRNEARGGSGSQKRFVPWCK